ncbi:MAG: hypothetical protein IJH37_01805, partial [Clostridia bacterium]|nr:hypothetical protein [Clostridia bacterium]
MKITKRILSVTIAATLAAPLFNGVNIFAEGEYSFADIELIMEEEGLNGSVSEHAPLNPVFVDIEPEESNDRDFEARAEELDEADDADTAPDEPDRSIDPDVVWDALFSMEFGDSYNKPYHHNSNSIAVTGDSNRLVIEETDLHLTGKNDLDFSLKRQYSNQDDNEMYFPSSSTTNIVTNFKLYSYRNTSTNEDINIAFLTEDQMYQFMPDEFCVSQLRANDRKSYRLSNGSYIYYYNFYNVYRFNADSGIVLQRNTGIAPVSIQIQDIGYGLTDYPMFSSSNNLYGGWRFVMPAASFHVCDWDYTNSSHTSISRDFIGAFRDIHGNVSMINAHDTVHFNNLSSSHMNVAQNNRGKSIQYTAFYNGTSTFANTGIKYNLTAQDQDGLTYYFYCDAFEQAISNHSAGTRFYMSVIAVEDNYGNYIRYLYGDEAKAGAITGIIDTYGREISISRTTNSCTVSYDDENSDTKTITYSSSTLPASTLNNNSLLGHRSVDLFTVTNQLGETTEYYSRPAELITYYESSASSKFYNVITGYEGAYISHQNNIELIEYPTGAKTEYEYTSLGIVDKSTKSMQQEYAVSASRDITDNSTENDTDYSFGNNTSGITKTAINNSSDAKTVSIHNEYRQLTSEKTTPSASLYPYYSVSYIYDTCGYPKNITTNNNGSSRTVYRTNYADGRVHTEYDGTYKTAYEYYGNNVIKTAITYKRPGSNYVEQFRYTTTPNAVGDKPEYARILKSTNGQVMSQVKYEYNSDGEISAIKQWTNDTNADGLLDETDDIIILNHSYQTGADNYLTYSEYINNVLNVDDTNEGTVSSTYKLNMFGKPVSKTDSYGVVSYIDYDDLDRPVKYTYANNAEATVVYSLSNLYTLVTTPDGIKKKNIYDKLGRLVKVQRIYGNVTNTLEEYSYDSAGRVSKKINRTDSNVGTM